MIGQGGTGSFPVVNIGRGSYAVPSHLLVPWSRYSIAITLLPLTAFTEDQCCTKGYRVFRAENSGQRGYVAPSHLLVPW